MEGTVADESLDPPARLLERLSQINGYVWEETIEPFHSSYDNWQAFGWKLPPSQPTQKNHSRTPNERKYAAGADDSKGDVEEGDGRQPVAARISIHALREERTFQICKRIHKSVDPNGEHIAKPIEITRLPNHPADKGPVIVCIFEFVGRNYLPRVIDNGPAYYQTRKVGDRYEAFRGDHINSETIDLQTFLDFAIGATECLELLHHGQRIVHGEIRGDAFHMNLEDGRVRFINFGSGLRTFEHGLTSTGWSALSREVGAKTKLSFMSPEQTGRMPAEPDSRTDIYSLGILFWTLLTKEDPFGGDTPMEIIQGVLGRRLPNVSSIRMDVPDVVGQIIQKMTAKAIGDRYHSASGLRYDLVEVRSLLGAGNSAMLENWKLGSKDISSFFRLPTAMIGRTKEHDEVVKIIEKVSRRHIESQKQDIRSLSSGSTLSAEHLEDSQGEVGMKFGACTSSDASSSAEKQSSSLGRSGSASEVKSQSNSNRARTFSSAEGPEVSPGVDVTGSSRSLTHSSIEILPSGGALPMNSGSPTNSLALRSTGFAEPVDSQSISGGMSLNSGSSVGRSAARAPSSVAPSMNPSNLGYPEPSSSRQAGVLKPWEKNSSLSTDSATNSSYSGAGSSEKANAGSAGSLANSKNAGKFRRKGRCEVVAISGAAGLGKSCLINSVQLEARRRGYFASSKFDRAKKTPFGPVLRLLSSLFKQVFSESNTNTPFHHILKGYIRPVWATLHKDLELPEFLIGTPQKGPRHSSQLSRGYNTSLQPSIGTGRESSPSSLPSNMYSMARGTQNSREFLRAGSSTKVSRLMNTFLDILRMFTQHKLICFCLDDLQFADDESMDLITQIVAARMKMVIMVTYRPDEILPEKIKSIIEPPDTEAYVKFNGVGVTRITLKPLTEDDIVQFVAATLCRPPEDVFPLAAVIQSKTAGNPFYMREMLDTCHRKQCIWYDYKQSAWCFSLDRIYTHFQTENYHDTLDDKFVLDRLNELPPASRAILAWASILGASFSFEVVQRLLTLEFDFEEDLVTPEGVSAPLLNYSEQDVVEGLQATIQAYIIVASNEDDRFRFAHDRYSQAALSLAECSAPKMHFIIAQTLMKYYSVQQSSRDDTALHIARSVDMIKDRVLHRQSYRKVLFDRAQAGSENGARSTAAKFYAACFALLQPNPWNLDAPDVYYDETLELYVRAAECYLYLAQYKEAKRLLDNVFENAKSVVDKAPAWVLQSRIFAQEGDSLAAFQALKQCLSALDIAVDDKPSFEKCDEEFERLSRKIKSMGTDTLISGEIAKNQNIAAVGAVLVETISAAFWTDTLTFYQMTLVMVNTRITIGNFPQAGMGFLHFAMIAITRFNMIAFAAEMGNVSLQLMERWQDPYTMGRGGTIYSLFVGHIHTGIQESLQQLEGAFEYAIQAGDRISTIMNFGLVANLKFFASENLADLETFVQYGCEEIQNWQFDNRGGTMAISVRQLSRALQGKTFINNPLEIMSDEQHNSVYYKSWLSTSLKSFSRPLLFYEGIEMIPLVLYGHYSRAIELGSKWIQEIDLIWSARNSRQIMLFQCLALCGSLWNKLQNPLRSFKRRSSAETKGNSRVEDLLSESELREETAKVIKEVNTFKTKIEDWQTVNDVNYLAWSKLLAAQVSELEGDHGKAMAFYEACLDHASANAFVFEEALGNYLYAEFFLRAGSRRAANSSLKEALQLFRRIGATGVVDHIEGLHSLLLQGPTKSMRFADASCQTDFAGDAQSVQYRTLEDNEDDESQRAHAQRTETKGDRIGAWQGGSSRRDAGSALSALDMLDLTSILESSQVISSVLQVDQLLQTMCEIILQNCGGIATSAAIVVEDDEPSTSAKWSIVASGEAERGASAHIPGIPLNETTIVAGGVIIYCTRFRETVFLSNILHDERFSNVTEAWLARNPAGKSVIALPIVHGDKPLLGVLYLEGAPDGFTDRNLTVLQLLVNQIGISYSNALTLKEVRKVSAFNTSMVDMQKAALAKAKLAESKAKRAEAEALASVKLAEEAARAKSIFLANVSHELRTPLNGVIGNSELLRDCNLTKEQSELADSIRISADLLLTVINDILDFSRMEADKMELCIESFKPDEMIREIVRSVSYSYRDKNRLKNIKILQDVHLPDLLILGDPVRLHQVLGNLIGNSMKFTEEGSIVVGARCDRETPQDATLTFWVKDSGIGIPPQKLSKLFKPFSQADASTARKYGGSGLGLSICKSLIEGMMGGKIQLESVEGQGTTALFTVTFKKFDENSNAPNNVGTPNGLGPQRHSLPHYDESESSFAFNEDFSSMSRKDIRICVAEDNRINQKIAIQFLEKLGYKHIHAYDNGLEAVEAARKKANEGEPYHIILMDVQMPVLDGYEATKLLRQDPLEDVRGVLVIAMTASAIEGDREKCLEAGMNDYLAKPVRVGVLQSKLEQYLKQPPLDVPNLEAEARKVARNVLADANEESSTPTPTPKPNTPIYSDSVLTTPDPSPQPPSGSSSSSLSRGSTPSVASGTVSVDAAASSSSSIRPTRPRIPHRISSRSRKSLDITRRSPNGE